MPTISQILITNTIDFGRSVLNQVSASINGMLATGSATTFSGNVVINPSNTTAASVNVGSGLIYGNGAGLFGLDANSVTLGLFRNSQLENSSITIVSANGINGVGTVSLGSSLTLNIVAVDSITNTRPDLAASANSVRWAESITSITAQNVAAMNAGVLAVSVGGTGLTSYTSGQILLGNGISGRLQSNVILAGAGIIADATSGGIQLAANVIQGSNIELTYLAGGGVSISANTPPIADQSIAGIVQLADTLLSTSITQVITANAVNGIAQYILSQPGIASASGRLIGIDIYKTPGNAGISGAGAASGTWIKRPNTDFILLTLIGAGGGGAVNTGNGTPHTSFIGFGGWSGALLEARINSANLPSTMNVTIGWGGNSSQLGFANTRANGIRGGNTVFSNGTFGYYANGGNGGIVHTTFGPVDCFYTNMAVDFPTIVAANVGIPTAPNPRPEYFTYSVGSPPTEMFNTITGGGSAYFKPSSGGSVPGYCMGGQSTEFCGPIGLLSWNSVNGPDVRGGSNGSGFGGGGGGGGYTYYDGLFDYAYRGASGANGLCIIKSFSLS